MKGILDCLHSRDYSYTNQLPWFYSNHDFSLTRDWPRRATFTGGSHDKKFHDAVINRLAATLYDENILITYGSANNDTGLAIAELWQIALWWLSSELLTYCRCEKRMWRAREYLNSPHSVCVFASFCYKQPWCIRKRTNLNKRKSRALKTRERFSWLILLPCKLCKLPHELERKDMLYGLWFTTCPQVSTSLTTFELYPFLHRLFNVT